MKLNKTELINICNFHFSIRCTLIRIQKKKFLYVFLWILIFLFFINFVCNSIYGYAMHLYRLPSLRTIYLLNRQ